MVECACSVVCCKFCEIDIHHLFGFSEYLQEMKTLLIQVQRIFAATLQD